MAKKKLSTLIPSKVRLKKDITYEVLFVDNFTDVKQVGEARPDHKQIIIKNNESDTETFKTFIHEVFHCFSFEYKDLNLTENQVQKLEEATFRFLRLNKLI